MSWNNSKSKACGLAFEEYMLNNSLLCMNDGQPIRRHSDSVVDLFIVNPKIVPEVVICETLSQESARSDHIGVMMEVYEKDKPDPVTVERYVIGKTDWNLWKECTEEKFKDWNKKKKHWDSVDQMADSFMEVFITCMKEAVAKQT